MGLIQSYTIANGRRERIMTRERSANRVKANGHHPGPGGTERASEDNVVRLPREWLGPREDLVPVAVDEQPVDTLVTPPSTHDFWGDPLIDGWGAPAEQPSPEPRRRPRRQRGFTSPHARVTSFRRFFGGSGDPAQWASVAGRAQSPSRAAPRHLRPSAGLAGAVVLMLLGVAISAGGQDEKLAHSVHAANAIAPEAPAVVAGIRLPTTGTVARLHARPSAVGIRRAPRRAVSPRRPIRFAYRRAGRRGTRGTRTITVEQVRYATPATTSPSPSTAPPPNVAPPVTTPAASPATAATAATRTSAGSRQPATGASGALGPGSSPDG